MVARRAERWYLIFLGDSDRSSTPRYAGNKKLKKSNTYNTPNHAKI